MVRFGRLGLAAGFGLAWLLAGCQNRPTTPPLGSPTPAPNSPVASSPAPLATGLVPGSPSPPPAEFGVIAGASFLPRADFDRAAGPDRARFAPAIVIPGRIRSPRIAERLLAILLIAPDPAALAAWPGPPDPEPLASQQPTEVDLNPAAAGAVDVAAGDSIDLYVGVRPTQVRVRRIQPPATFQRPEPAVYLTLATAQVLLGRPDQVNAVLLPPTGTGPGSTLRIVPLPAAPAAVPTVLAGAENAAGR